MQGFLIAIAPSLLPATHPPPQSLQSYSHAWCYGGWQKVKTDELVPARAAKRSVRQARWLLEADILISVHQQVSLFWGASRCLAARFEATTVHK